MMKNIHKWFWIVLVAFAGNQPIKAEIPEGFAVLGNRIPDCPPPQGLVEIVRTEKRLPPKPSNEDEKSGYVVYSRSYSLPVNKQGAPELDELTDKIQAFAAPDEYEPLVFALYALKDLKDLRVEVTPLAGPEGATVPRDHIDLRCLGYGWRKLSGMGYDYAPGFLEHFDSVSIPAEESRAFWVTVKVPENAPAGIYEGRARITADGQSREVKLRLRVLPFKLDHAPYMASICASTFQMYGDIFGTNLHEKIVDLREHGFGDAFGYFPFKPVITKGADGRPKLDFDKKPSDLYYSCNEIIAALRKANTLGPIYARPPQVPWGKEGTPEFEKAFIDIIRQMLDYARKNDWPLLFFEMGDEVESSKERLQRCRYLYRLLHEAGANGVNYLNGPHAKIDSPSMLWPYMKNVCINIFDPEMVERMRQRRQRLWLYNVGATRFSQGWKCIFSGAKFITQYTYQTSKYANAGVFFYCFAAPDAVTKNPVPRPDYECMREGIDDARYYATLLNFIGRAKISRLDNAEKEAAKAEKMLNEWFAGFSLDSRAMADWQEKMNLSPGDLDKMRWRMARHILAIQETLKGCENEIWYK